MIARVLALVALTCALFAPCSAAAEEGGLALAMPKLARKRGFVIESVETALTAYVQDGPGYQSKQGPVLGPGSQRLTVFQPQLLVTARQNERITHRFWMPVDMITAASPNQIDRGRRPDMLSNASRQNQAVSFDWGVSYDQPRRFSASMRNLVHIEENFRSWASGVGASYSFADDNAIVSANANQVFDWFTRYDKLGFRFGRAERTTTNGNLGFTQVLTPWTVAHVNYGVSAQYGEMSNTWNTYPLAPNDRGSERLPQRRIRQAVVARFAQFLPWNGALKGFYRFYGDSWAIYAHAVEGQLLQRLSPSVFIRATYRFYTQTAARYFTTLAEREIGFLTADSDLGAFDTHTVGGKVSWDVPLFGGAHLDAGYERYWRTDGLVVHVALWQAGTKF